MSPVRSKLTETDALIALTDQNRPKTDPKMTHEFRMHINFNWRKYISVLVAMVLFQHLIHLVKYMAKDHNMVVFDQ